jgi:hypothetical protein
MNGYAHGAHGSGEAVVVTLPCMLQGKMRTTNLACTPCHNHQTAHHEEQLTCKNDVLLLTERVIDTAVWGKLGR